MIGIYKITNPQGKSYIGQSKNIDNRIMMDILYPETIGMEEDERKIAIDGIKKRKLRKEKLDNLLNEKRQN